VRRGLFIAGKVLGMLSGIAAGALWAFAIWVPEVGFAASAGGPVFLLVAFTMLLLSIIAVIASVNGHAGVLLVIFFASFFPVGLMMLAAEDWLQWIGRVTLGFAVAGMLMWRGAERVGHAGAADDRRSVDTSN
jgi:hypothetical protein